MLLPIESSGTFTWLQMRNRFPKRWDASRHLPCVVWTARLRHGEYQQWSRILLRLPAAAGILPAAARMRRPGSIAEAGRGDVMIGRVTRQTGSAADIDCGSYVI
jgi:hypothetical protein